MVNDTWKRIAELPIEIAVKKSKYTAIQNSNRKLQIAYTFEPKKITKIITISRNVVNGIIIELNSEKNETVLRMKKDGCFGI